MSSLPFSRLIWAKQAVKILKLRHVCSDGGDVAADLLDRRRQRALTPARDEDVGALVHELLRRGQADAAVAPGDDRDFPFQFLRHGTPPLPVRAVRVTGYE